MINKRVIEVGKTVKVVSNTNRDLSKVFVGEVGVVLGTSGVDYVLMIKGVTEYVYQGDVEEIK